MQVRVARDLLKGCHGRLLANTRSILGLLVVVSAGEKALREAILVDQVLVASAGALHHGIPTMTDCGGWLLPALIRAVLKTARPDIGNCRVKRVVLAVHVGSGVLALFNATATNELVYFLEHGR